MSKECLKTLGVLARDSECPPGCRAIRIAQERIRNEGDGTRATIVAITSQVSKLYCPTPAEMVAYKPARNIVW